MSIENNTIEGRLESSKPQTNINEAGFVNGDEQMHFQRMSDMR